MICFLWIAFIVLSTLILAYHRASLSVWTLSGLLGLLILSKLSPFSIITLTFLWAIFLVLAIILNIRFVRRQLITKFLWKLYQKAKPSLSKTEREAIAAGTADWAGDLFSGIPDWHKLLQQPPYQLTDEETAFLQGPVEDLCHLIDDWDITHRRADLPPEIWQFLKEHKFFGMIIPKCYGGLEFSAKAHSAVLLKVGAMSASTATTIGVPNSLGPAELILKYGTEEQKNYYLPRLASGEEIPCFALTGPEAGSDAASLPDLGIVCRGQFDGKEIVGIKLNFNKRYITLAPVATVIGLAFRLRDPSHLLGKEENIGITCALLPRHTPGIEIGRRHFPLNSAFQNGPIHGKDVFIPLDWIIGGVARKGEGWHMLMECLAVGRGITLPSLAAGGSKAAAVASGAYSRIRRQFGLPIGYFEGVEEALTRIGANAYVIDASRQMTLNALDRGEKPAVLTAIMKYHATSRGRQVANDAMDIHGGKGICLGPRNYLGRNYQSIPISITVEGANILTRSMIIFGQGAMLCHPYLLRELEAANFEDEKLGLLQFDYAVFGHFGFIFSNLVRTFMLGLTASWIVSTPHSKLSRYYQHLTRFAASFAFLVDVSLGIFKGNLKRKEKISARLGDILSLLYLGSAVLKNYHDQDEPQADFPLVKWVLQDILFNIQKTLDEILKNLPYSWLGCLLHVIIFPLGKTFSPPTDALGHEVAKSILSCTETSKRLSAELCLSETTPAPLGRLLSLLKKTIELEPLEKKVQEAEKQDKIYGSDFGEVIQEAFKNNIITLEEKNQLQSFYELRKDLLAVDDFDPKELPAGK